MLPGLFIQTSFFILHNCSRCQIIGNMLFIIVLYDFVTLKLTFIKGSQLFSSFLRLKHLEFFLILQLYKASKSLKSSTFQKSCEFLTGSRTDSKRSRSSTLQASLLAGCFLFKIINQRHHMTLKPAGS